MTDSHINPTLKPEIFHNKRLIITTTYRNKPIVSHCLDQFLSILSATPDSIFIIIDNHSKEGIQDYVKSINHPQVYTYILPFNFGKALAVNFFIKNYLRPDYCPKTIVSLDPDTCFSQKSFHYLLEASEHLPQCGMIGMRYTKNDCNPERNLFFKPKIIRGSNKQTYALTCPFMCTVAGPVFAIQGQRLYTHLHGQLFPKDYIKVYGGDDSATYNKLRWNSINGYLEGTEATHLLSGATTCPIPPIS